VLKDWRVLRRDPQALLQLAWPLAFILVWLLPGRMGATSGLGFFLPGNLFVWWTGLSVAFFCLMFSSSLALTAISREGRSFWVLRSAPLSAWELIVSKFWANYLLCLGLGLLFSLGAAWLQRTGLAGFSYSLGLVMLIGMGITAIYLAFGAQSPNLTWDNPRQAYDQASGCLGFIIGGVYALGIVGVLAIPIGLNTAWEPLLNFLRLVVAVGITAGVTWKALQAARQGVEAIEL
jgi:ABC-2 type transport system permease protein